MACDDSSSTVTLTMNEVRMILSPPTMNNSENDIVTPTMNDSENDIVTAANDCENKGARERNSPDSSNEGLKTIPGNDLLGSSRIWNLPEGLNF